MEISCRRVQERNSPADPRKDPLHRTCRYHHCAHAYAFLECSIAVAVVVAAALGAGADAASGCAVIGVKKEIERLSDDVRAEKSRMLAVESR